MQNGSALMRYKIGIVSKNFWSSTYRSAPQSNWLRGSGRLCPRNRQGQRGGSPPGVPLVLTGQQRGQGLARSWGFIAGRLAVACAHVIHPLKAPRQPLAALTTQACRMHQVRRFESKMALATGQDQRLAGQQTGQGCHVILPGAGLLSGNAHELKTLAFGQAWELLQRKE